MEYDEAIESAKRKALADMQRLFPKDFASRNFMLVERSKPYLAVIEVFRHSDGYVYGNAMEAHDTAPVIG